MDHLGTIYLFLAIDNLHCELYNSFVDLLEPMMYE